MKIEKQFLLFTKNKCDKILINNFICNITNLVEQKIIKFCIKYCNSIRLSKYNLIEFDDFRNVKRMLYYMSRYYNDIRIVKCNNLNYNLIIIPFESSMEKFKILLDNGTNINGHDNNITAIPLIGAIQNNDINVVNYLIEHGANINIKNTYGKTPLYYAIHKQNIEIVKILLNNNAIITKDYKSNPILKASIGNNIEILNLIINYSLLNYSPDYVKSLILTKNNRGRNSFSTSRKGNYKLLIETYSSIINSDVI